MDDQLQQYVPVLLLGLLALAFAGGTLFISVWIGWRSKRSKIKDTAYECGMLPVGEGSTRMSVKFYLVAMLFILFDIEVVFLYPWAVSFRALGMFGFVEMLVFVAILMLGYVYLLKKGALKWQ
jgi:NADH-quinone oxidoreductase subunit A